MYKCTKPIQTKQKKQKKNFQYHKVGRETTTYIGSNRENFNMALVIFEKKTFHSEEKLFSNSINL